LRSFVVPLDVSFSRLFAAAACAFICAAMVFAGSSEIFVIGVHNVGKDFTVASNQKSPQSRGGELARWATSSTNHHDQVHS
jgi:hypothetical protein